MQRIRVLRHFVDARGTPRRPGTTFAAPEGSEFIASLCESGYAMDATLYALKELAELGLDVKIALSRKPPWKPELDENGEPVGEEPWDWRPDFRKACEAAGVEHFTLKK